MTRTKVIAGNWKMNCSLEQSQALVTEIRGMVRDERNNDSEIILCPTYLALPSACKLVQGSSLFIGAQNCHSETNGAYTGEVSAEMLNHLGVSHVIIGHSERREYQNETNAFLKEKVKSAIKNNMVSIFCLGESLEQRESGQLWDVLSRQLSESLLGTSVTAKNLIIAYEPIWAIGTGVTASAAQAQEVHSFIRNWVAQHFSPEMAEETRILYGGSMKPDNAEELLSQIDIDGGLIGGASLKPRDFVNIHKLAK